MAQLCAKDRKTLFKVSKRVLGETLANRFCNDVNRWVTQHGIDFAVNRLKSAMVAAEHLRNHEVSRANETLLESRLGIRKDPSGRFTGIPRGVLGFLVLQYLGARKRQAIRRVYLVFRVYTAFIHERTTAQQHEKAVIAISSSSNARIDACEEAVSRIFSWAQVCSEMRKMIHPLVSKGRNSISLETEDGSKSFHSTISGLHQTGKRPWGRAVASLLTTGYLPPSLKELLPLNSLQGFAELFQSSYHYATRGADGEIICTKHSKVLGHISYLQEGGGKARVVCLPHFWLQMYLRPLMQKLFIYIRALESGRLSNLVHGVSVVQNQNDERVQCKLLHASGITAYCFDLSSATDRFPLGLQLDVLRRIGLSEWVNPFQDVARGLYLDTYSNSLIQYSVGQPMGLCPSFPLFHLTHFILLESLARDLGCTGTCFAVLGDDVIITDNRLASSYAGIMGLLDVPISPTKTHKGENLMSFAGFRYLTVDDGIDVFRPFKFGRNLSLKGRVITLLDSLGNEVSRWSNWWARAFQLYRKTRSFRQPDLTPLPDYVSQVEVGISDPKVVSRWIASLLYLVSSEIEYKLSLENRPDFPGLMTLLEFQKRNWERDQDVFGVLLDTSSHRDPFGTYDPTCKPERFPGKEASLLQDPLIRELKDFGFIQAKLH